MALLFGTLATVNADHEMLAALNYSDCGEIQSCSLCAMVDECVYCSDSCQDIDSSCIDGDGIEEAPGCIDYESVSVLGFDANERLTYQFSVNLCEAVTKGNDTNTTYGYEFEDVDAKELEYTCIEQTRDIMFWVSESDIDTMTFKLFAKLLTIVIDQETLISDQTVCFLMTCLVEIMSHKKFRQLQIFGCVRVLFYSCLTFFCASLRLCTTPSYVTFEFLMYKIDI